jgi:general secretion pathway protein G
MKKNHLTKTVARLRNRNEKGFTLIEIMIVLTLLGIVATIGITNYVGKLEEGKRKSSKILMQQMRTSLDDYMRTCGLYPTTAQGGLDALINKPADDSCKDYDTNGYLKDRKIPKDSWNRDFIYLSEDGRSYVLKSLGRDGKEGGDANDRDISTEDADF